MKKHRWNRLLRAWLLALSAGLVCPAAQAFTNIATGLNGAVGIAADPTGSAVYFTEWNTGALKRIALTPGCTAATPCPVTTVASGFSHPQDVALDLAHGNAYVTTRDDAGTTGALWRVDLATGTPSLVTFNLGAPHQIALDVPTNSAYVVGFSSGRLWKINLATGSKTTILSGLVNPVGVAFTADRTRAYVTEQSAPGRLTAVDINLRTRIGTVANGLLNPFYLNWTDPAQSALYIVERDPNNRVLRYDVPSSITAPVITGLPFRPSGIALDIGGGAAYVSTNASVVRVDLAALPSAPVFLGVGNVPSTSIGADGYATTPPGYFLQVKDVPFGGTLNIFGNFTNFVALGATHYRVNVSYAGGPAAPVLATWGAARWNPVTSLYETAPVAPLPGDDRYAIPSEYLAGHPERWYPPFLMVRWPSGANGLYTFSVQIFSLSGTTWTDLTPLLPAAANQLTVRIDNDPPDVDITQIYLMSPFTAIQACDIVGPPTFPAVLNPRYQVRIRAYDPNGHMLNYGVVVYWGHNQSSVVIPTENYQPGHVDADGPRLWRGVSNLLGPAAGWPACRNCAHTFFVDAWKRTIDGYGYILHRNAHQSITINNTTNTCP